MSSFQHIISDSFQVLSWYHIKCPQISYTKVFDKMAYANSADLDQTAPEGLIWVYIVCNFQSILRNNCIKSKI